MAMKVPLPKRQISEDIGSVPTPPSIQPNRAAFGENVVKAQGSITGAANVLSSVLEKQAVRLQKEKDSKYLLDLDSQYTQYSQDLLWNTDNEDVLVNGQRMQRPKGIMNRSGDFTDGSVFEYDSKNKQYIDRTISSTPKHLKQDATKFLTNTYLSNRNSVIGHEIKQKHKATDLQFTSSIEQQKDSLYMAQDPISLQRKLDSLDGVVDKYTDWLGITDKATRKIIKDKHISEGVEKTIEGALEVDISGEQARALLRSTQETKMLSKGENDKLSKKIDIQVKQNARIVEDDLLSQFLIGTLTTAEVMAASAPKEKGGIGASKANSLINKMISAQNAKVKDISKEDGAAEDYVTLVDLMLSDRIDQFEAKKLLVDANANGMPREDVEQLRKVNAMLKDMKWNTDHPKWNNAIDTMKSWYGKERTADNTSLATSIKTLLSSDKDPEETTNEIIRNDYNSKNPDTPINKDEDVLKVIETNEQTLKEEAASIVSQISEFLIPSAEAAEVERKAQPKDEAQEAEDAAFEEMGQEEFMSGVVARVEEEMSKSFETNEALVDNRANLVNDAMDIISGGMTLEEAEQLRDKTLEFYKRLPSSVGGVLKETARFGLEQMMSDLRLASDFLHAPIETLMTMKDRPSPGKRPLTKEVKEDALDIVKFVFDPWIKRARGIGGLLFPEEGDILGKQGSIKDRLQQSVKDMLADPGMGYIAERISEDVSEGRVENPTARAFTIFAAAAAGTISEAATFSPKLIWNALKSQRPAYQISARQKQILIEVEKDLPQLRKYFKARMSAKGWPEAEVNKVTSQLQAVHFARGAAYDPNLGNYFKSVIDRTVPRFGLKTLASETGELSFLGEQGVPLKSNLLALASSVKMPAFTTGVQALNILKKDLTKDELEFSGVEQFLEGKEKVSQKELVEFLDKNKVELNVIKTAEGAGPVESVQSQELLDADESVQALADMGYTASINEGDPGVIGFIDNETGDILAADEIMSLDAEAGELAQDIEAIADHGNFEARGRGSSEMIARLESDHNIIAVEDEDFPSGIAFEDPDGSLVSAENIERNFPEAGLLAREIESRGVGELQATPAEDLASGNFLKFTAYQLPGATNYREIKIQYNPKIDLAKELARVPAHPQSPLVKGFESPHWEELNILAHLRVNTRLDTEGNKVLFLEELQPEWIKAFREGTTTEKPPFTKEWVLLGVKQAIEEAVASGADKVVWITGKQTVDRYDLSKQVDKIEWNKAKVNGEDLYDFEAFQKGEAVISKGDLTAKELEAHIGKDVTNKIVSSGKNIGKLKGEDLKIGGTWATELYDKILPNTANKYIKKWGSKVEDMKLESEAPDVLTHTVQGLTISGDTKVFAIKNGKTGEVVDIVYTNKEDAITRAAELSKPVNVQQGFKVTPQMVKEVSEQGQPMFGQRLASTTLTERLGSQRGQAGQEKVPEVAEGKGTKPELISELEVQKAKAIEAANQIKEKDIPEVKGTLATKDVKKTIKKSTESGTGGKTLKRGLQREQKATRVAEKEGVKAGIEKGSQKVRNILEPKIAKIKGKAQLKKEDLKLKKNIKKQIKEIKAPPAKNLPIEYKDAITDIQKNIDAGKINLTTILKTTDELGLDAELVDQMKDINKLSAADMTVEELNDVHDVIQQLKHSGSIANRYLTVKTNKTIQETVLEGAKVITKGKGLSEVPPIAKHLKKEWGKMSKKLKEKYIAEHRRPEAIFEQLDGFKEGVSYNTAFKPQVKAEQQYQVGMGDRVNELSKIVEDINVAKAINKKEKVKGFDVELTRDNMYFVFANSLNVQNKSHLVASGVSSEMIENVIAKLSSKEVEMVNDVLNFLKDQWNGLDKVYSALRGKHMGRVKTFFFPIMNLEKIGNLEAIEMNIKMFNDFQRTGIPQGFTKGRVPMSEKAFKRYSFFENVHRYTRQAEYYKAFALPIRDASRYLRNPVIKQAISENMNPATYKVLNSWLDDIARGRDRTTGEFLDDISALIRTNFVVSVLGANLSTVTKQFPSFVQGAGMIGEKEAMSGLTKFLKNPNEAIAFVNGKSVQLKNRRFSQERELQEIAEGRGIESIIGGKTKLSDLNIKQLKQMVKEGSMLPILLADRATVTSIWRGAYDKKMAETLNNESVSIEYADKVIRRTQPQSGLVHLPAIFKSTPMMKLPTTFKNQPNQNWNLIYDTWVGYNKGAKTKETFQQFMRGTFYYLIFGGILFGALSRKRLQTGPKELAIDIINQGVGGLVGLSQFVSKIKYPWGSTDLLDATLTDASKIVTSKTLPTKAKYIGRTIAKVKGVPGYTAVERFITRETIQTKLLGGPKNEKKKRSF